MVRTTFAPPSSKSIDEPCLQDDFREIFALPVLVFLRRGCGEKYLSPRTLVAMTFPFLLTFAWIAWDRDWALAGTPVPDGPFTFLRHACIWPGVLAFMAGRALLAFGLIGFFTCLVVEPRWFMSILKAVHGVAPTLLLQDSLLQPKVYQAAAGFLAVAVLAGALKIWIARKHSAPHQWCVGRSIFERGLPPGASNESRWLLVLFFEPMIVAGVGIAVLLLFANWFGAYFIFAAMAMCDATLQRYMSAKDEVVEAVSNIAHAEVRLDAIETALVEPKPGVATKEGSNKPFVVRPADRLSSSGDRT